MYLYVILSTDTNVYAICLTFIILEQIDMNMKTEEEAETEVNENKNDKR